MATRNSGDWSRGEDLIDFEVGSPDIPRGSLSESVALLDDENIVSETLLDSELLRLEETLQSSTSTPQNRSRCDSRDSIELEHILISIDDEFDSCRSINKTLEISNAIHELDQVINNTTNSSNSFHTVDETDGLVDDRNVPSVEDCLRELDNYLQGFDTSGSEATDAETSGTDLEIKNQQNQQLEYSVGVSQGERNDYNGISDRLRCLASRSRSLQNGTSNLGFDPQEWNMAKKRPFSADAESDWNHGMKRNSRIRSTIAVSGRSVPYVSTRDMNQVEYDTDDEDIDWSWVQDIVRDDTPGEACANGSTSSVTVTEDQNTAIVEVPVSQPVAGCSRTAEIPPEPSRMVSELADKDEDDRDHRVRAGSSWLRTSMRRVRHFRLPSDPATTELETVVTATTNSTPNVLVSENVPPILVVETPRPVSAPVRTSSTNSALNSATGRSRSRSRASEVSAIPGGRARSSSESSRCRRQRSLSSSESSLASSVDSSPSCTPASSPTHPTTTPEIASNGAPRSRRTLA